MKYKYASDSHSHSNCSPDGKNSIDEMCERAKALGLYYYTVTDHFESNDADGSKVGFNYNEHSPAAFKRMAESAERLHHDVRLLKGIELGQAMQNLEAAEEAVKRPYDFVLGSVHNIIGFEDFYFLDYENMPDGYIDGLLTSYFGEMLDMVKWGKIDAVAHLTYPLRYIEGDHGIKINMEPHFDEIKNVFLAMIERGIALEINTSGLRQKIGRCLPDITYVNMYKALGGKLITIGSDAHSAEDLGKGIDEGLDMLKEAGYKEFAVFINHEPKMLPIE